MLASTDVKSQEQSAWFTWIQKPMIVGLHFSGDYFERAYGAIVLGDAYSAKYSRHQHNTQKESRSPEDTS